MIIKGNLIMRVCFIGEDSTLFRQQEFNPEGLQKAYVQKRNPIRENSLHKINTRQGMQDQTGRCYRII